MLRSWTALKELPNFREFSFSLFIFKHRSNDCETEQGNRLCVCIQEILCFCGHFLHRALKFAHWSSLYMRPKLSRSAIINFKNPLCFSFFNLHVPSGYMHTVCIFISGLNGWEQNRKLGLTFPDARATQLLFWLFELS